MSRAFVDDHAYRSLGNGAESHTEMLWLNIKIRKPLFITCSQALDPVCDEGLCGTYKPLGQEGMRKTAVLEKMPGYGLDESRREDQRVLESRLDDMPC